MRKGKLQGFSKNFDDEFLSLALISVFCPKVSFNTIQGQAQVVAGTQSGSLQIFDWGDWEDSIDSMPGHPNSVDCVVPIDYTTVATASSDGIIRVVQISPQNFLGVIGMHENYPVERLTATCTLISHNSASEFLAIKSLWQAAAMMMQLNFGTLTNFSMIQTHQ